jgi:hypothetical protein
VHDKPFAQLECRDKFRNFSFTFSSNYCYIATAISLYVIPRSNTALIERVNRVRDGEILPLLGKSEYTEVALKVK